MNRYFIDLLPLIFHFIISLLSIKYWSSPITGSYKLKIQLSQKTTEYVIDHPVTGVGRSDDNQLVIDDSQISRHHARIEQTGDELYVIDLGSSNGTSVNGTDVAPESRHHLKDGDVITMGNASLTLRFSGPVNQSPAPMPVSVPQSSATPEVPAQTTPDIPAKKRSWIKWFVIGIAIVVVIFGALMVIGSFSSSSEQDSENLPGSMQTYSNSERQFYFTYPPDWEEMPSSVLGQDAGIITGFWAPTEEYGVTSNVLVATEDLPGGMDIDTYFDLARESFEDGTPVTISQDDITVADFPAIKWVYQSPSVKPVTQMQVSFIRDDIAWLFIFTCADKAFDANEAIFDDMVASFRFTDSNIKVFFSTAKLSEATLTTEVDADMLPVNATDVFAVDTPVIHCSVKLSNAPDDTEILAEWVYLYGEDEDLNNYLIDSTLVLTGGTRYMDFSLSSPESGWPVGEYELVLYVNGKEDIRIPFSVKKLNIVHMMLPVSFS